MLLNLIMFAVAIAAAAFAGHTHERATRARDEAERQVAQAKADMLNCEQAMLAAMRERNRYAARLQQQRNERAQTMPVSWPVIVRSMN